MEHLLGYLSVVDYINLRHATVDFISTQIPKPADVLKQRLCNRLQRELSFTQEELMRFLGWLEHNEEREMFLTGGFLVALLTGSPFDVVKQDIDVFSTDMDYDSNFGFTGNPPAFPSDESYDEDFPMSMVCNYKVQSARVQIVVWHRANGRPWDLIDHFDMSVCRNAFNLKRGLHVGDLSGLTLEECDVDMTNLLSRISKIQHRDSLIGWYERQEARFSKYRARGYDVRVTHPQGDALKNAFVMHTNVVGIFDQREMYALMGTHSPASCVFIPDCRCKSALDANARYCIPNTCSCDHHKVFYTTMKERWVARKREALALEYTNFWFPSRPPTGEGDENN